MAERGTKMTLISTPVEDELEARQEERVTALVRQLYSEVANSKRLPLRELVARAHALAEGDPASVREAISRLVYEGEVQLTDDRHLEVSA